MIIISKHYSLPCLLQTVFHSELSDINQSRRLSPALFTKQVQALLWLAGRLIADDTVCSRAGQLGKARAMPARSKPVHRRADGGARLTHGWRRVRWGGANRVWMSLHKASAHCLESLEMKVGKPAFRYFLSGRGRTHMQYL